MRIATIASALLVSIPERASAQEWIEYPSRQDGFSINFPGEPQITEAIYSNSYHGLGVYTRPAYRATGGGQ